MDFGIPEDYRPSPSSNQHSGPVVVEDLIQGLNEWRNIQDIVRITFKAFHDVLKAQGEAIKTLERALETKVSRSEVQTVLDQKANTAEVAQRLREVETALFSKADIVDVERRALKTELDASLKIHMTDVYAVIGTKADDSDVRVWKDQVDRSHQQLRAEVLQLGTGLHNVVTQVDMKANISDVSAALATKADAAEVAEVLRDKVSCKAMGEALARKAEKTATDTLESDMHSVSTHLQQVEHIVESNAAVTSQELQSLRTGLDNTAKELKRALDLQGSRLTHVQEEVQQQSAQHKEGLSLKADYKEMQRLLAAKAETSQVNDALATKANTATVRALIDKLEQAVVAAGKTDILQQDMASKANTKDVCTLLDGKANIEDVNKALLQVCQELENKAGLEELDRALKDQSIINASLCADMSLGRWLWKSTKTKQGGAVPWNVQTLNSDPENFLWEKDKATIMTVVPGLYEVTFGFFSKKKPTVQLLVNGEPVLSAVNSSSYVIHHSSGRLATVSAHPAGNVTGLTCIDFLSLPPRAKLAITYQGEEKGEGFFCVKKL